MGHRYCNRTVNAGLHFHKTDVHFGFSLFKISIFVDSLRVCVQYVLIIFTINSSPEFLPIFLINNNV